MPVTYCHHNIFMKDPPNELLAETQRLLRWLMGLIVAWTILFLLRHIYVSVQEHADREAKKRLDGR